MFTWGAEVVEKYLSRLKEGGRWSRYNRKAELPGENSFPLRENLLWRESPEIPTGLFLTRRAGCWDGAGRDLRETASPRPRRKRPQGTASGNLTNGHRPDRGRQTARVRGGGPRGRGRGKSAVPTAVPASVQPSPGCRARARTASRPKLPPSSPLPQLPAATHRTGTGCYAKGFPAGRGKQNPGTAANRNRLHNTGRAVRWQRRKGVGWEVKEQSRGPAQRLRSVARPEKPRDHLRLWL